MPPLIVWAVGAVGATVVGRWLVKEARRINAELHPGAAPAAELREERPTLRRDPQSGVYRPEGL